ncbi:MAG: hypothetical protein A3J83_00160 [Elusimicrobia bacterium RIFOXYA2_FULL_40_6]|nr:MAG: hypothetical protein A3J83_00160 [Elusimicrobia bacterium RIFOXYA2_FULL_40_6]
MKVVISEVAKKAKVTKGTVSKVINNYPSISQELRTRVMKVIEQMGYVPNSHAQRLGFSRKQKEGKRLLTKNIVCIAYSGYNRIEDLELTETIEYMNEELKKNGYRLYGCYSCDELANDPELFNRVINTDTVDGVITIATQLEGIYKRVIDNMTNIISVREIIRDNNSIDYVIPDGYQGSMEAVRYLVTMNHKRIGFIFANTPLSGGAGVGAGFLRAQKEAGLKCYKNLMKVIPERSSEETKIKESYEFMKEIIENNVELPSAMATSDPLFLIGINNALKEKNFKVPEDISLITFQNDQRIKYIKPAITTIDYDMKKMASVVINQLIMRIQNPDTEFVKILLPYKLEERESCRRI